MKGQYFCEQIVNLESPPPVGGFCPYRYGIINIEGGNFMLANSKKVIILYVLNALKLYSSADTPVGQTAIAKYLNDIDIPCDRKTVGRNIRYLIEFGYPIKRQGTKGYYLDREELARVKKKFVI